MAGAARPWLLLVLLLLIGLGAWILFYQATFVALPYNDAMDYASLGRNISRGQGITSAYLTPLGLSIHPFPQPNLWRAPLWPLTIGFVQHFLPATDAVVAGTTGFFYLGGLVLLFLLARRLFNTGVATASALIYIFSPINLHFSTSGLTEPIALFLMLLWFYLLTLPGCRTSFGDCLVGAAGGLFYLARYNALLFLPLVAIYWWMQRREKGWLPLARYAAGFFAPAGPWLLRNLHLFGNPFFSLQKFEIPMFTDIYPAYSLYMIPKAPDVFNFIRTHPLALWDKFQTGIISFGAEFFSPDFSGIATVLLVLALAALIMPLGKRARGYHFLVAACFLIQLLALAVIHYIPRLFFIFFPFYLIFGLASLQWLLRTICRGHKILSTVLLILFTVLLIGANPPDCKKPNAYINLAEQFAGPLADLNRIVGSDEVVVSNDGHLIAWYSDRAAVKLPLHPEMVRELEEYAPISAIFISHRITWNTPEIDPAWMEIFQDAPAEVLDFQLYRVYENGTLVYLKNKNNSN